MQKSSNPAILMGVLDWGLGHATRSVPIIRELQKQEVRVLIAAENRAKAFLQKEFPEIQIFEFPNYNIKYPRNGMMAWRMFLKSKTIFKTTRKEHLYLKEFVKSYKIDAVLSDNRYGLWCNEIPSVLITHQLNIQTPFLLNWVKPIIDYLLSKQLNHFNEIWIPDFENGFKISGKLASDKSMHKKVFIGPLSRFEHQTVNQELKYDIAVLLSGPEPQRFILERSMINELKGRKLKVAILKGKTEEEHCSQVENITLYSHLETKELETLIKQSGLIISRSGYSTIMDLLKLKKKAAFIPTPGQTEQEYLAKYYQAKRIFPFMAQNKVNLNKVLTDINNYNSKKIIFAPELLSAAIEKLLESINK